MSAVAVAPAQDRAEWTTPQLLRAGLLAVCVASAILMSMAISGARSLRHSMQVIGRDTAPSIIAAEHIRAALADMDADAANELLGKERVMAARHEFEGRRKEAIDALIDAARNITYPTELPPIETMSIGIGSYTAAIQQVRDSRDAGDKAWTDRYHAAEKIMDETLLPAAVELDRANRDELDRAYRERESSATQASLAMTAAALLTGGLLIGLQMFLMRRMRRVLNPLLIGATIVTFVFTVYTTKAFRAEAGDLKVAAKDAFDSIHLLWQAESTADTALAEEGRYLADSSLTTAYQKDFVGQVSKIGDESTGYLGDETKNLTFPGERESAAEMAANFRTYVASDKRMRALEQSGKHQAAVDLYFGINQPGGPFNSFDAALGRTLEINQKAFDAAVSRGFREVNGFDVTAPLWALGIALLTFLGLRPRMREYYA